MWPSGDLHELVVDSQIPLFDGHVDRGDFGSFGSDLTKNPCMLWAKDEAEMGGIYVLPTHRNQGVGSALMRATLSGLRERAKKRLVVPETITSLDSDLPSIRLYKQSGARVRAEYLHLQLDIPTLRH